MNSRLTVCAVATLFMGTVQSFAGVRDDVLESVGKCASLGDDRARLACYDALAPHVKNALATPPNSLGRNPTTEEQQSWFGFDISGLFGGGSIEPTKPEDFGRERTTEAQAARAEAEAKAEVVDSITAGVTDVAFTPFGQFILILDNGQIWRQLKGDADRAHFRSNPRDNRVTISRGLIGSYNLKINDSEHVYKVTRVK